MNRNFSNYSSERTERTHLLLQDGGIHDRLQKNLLPNYSGIHNKLHNISRDRRCSLVQSPVLMDTHFLLLGIDDWDVVVVPDEMPSDRGDETVGQVSQSPLGVVGMPRVHEQFRVLYVRSVERIVVPGVVGHLLHVRWRLELPDLVHRQDVIHDVPTVVLRVHLWGRHSVLPRRCVHLWGRHSVYTCVDTCGGTTHCVCEIGELFQAPADMKKVTDNTWYDDTL